MVLKQRKTVLIVSALLTAQMVMQEAVQAFEEVSQPEVQITETAQEGELVSQSDGDDIWTETYTYVSDTNTPHAFAETVEKQGDWYAMKDVEYQVTELTTQLIQKSEAMWAYASYEPEQEIEEAGIHYTLTSLSKDEWMQTDRLKNVTKYLSCQEGQEVSETLDVETADEVTGEALYGTIGRIELKEDGADWKEGALEEWDIYSWNGESWVYQRNDECFYATEESPWFEGYEAEQEIEEAGIHYTLTSLSKDEWMQTDRLKNVTKYLSCQEGQEVSETLDVETADEVTGEALYGTIGRIELKEDGADWKEGALEEWDIYSWNGESWVYQRNDECFYATEESPWFEGYEAVFMQEHHLDGAFNQITSIEWYGDGWQDEEGNWKRSVRITGNKMVPRYQAIYSGDVAQPDLPMVCYKAQYTSDPQGYLITADVMYEKMQEEAVQEEENADESTLKSISEELIKTLQQNKTNEKFWYLLLAALMAVSVGLQVAVIFVLAFRER